MNTNIPILENDYKLDYEPNSICRCCLMTERLMFKITEYRQLLMDFAEIIVSETDGLPQWICYECSALIKKSVNFKKKVLRSHSILYDYHSRCAPFPVEGPDAELKSFSSPQLCSTSILIIDSLKNKTGFHETLEHEKRLNPLKVYEIFSPGNDILPVKDYIPDDMSVKDEHYGSEFEDDMPLEEIRLSKNKESEDSAEPKVKLEKKAKKRKVKKKDKSKHKKLVKNNEENNGLDYEAEPPKRSMLKRALDIDETKIRIIKLDPAEQIKQREEESKVTLKFPFQCHLCFKGFNFEEKLKNHMNKHSPSRGPYKCETCSMYLPSNYSASVHALIHTQRYECVQCGRQMVDRLAILNHYRSQHEGVLAVFTCQICGKVSNNEKTHRGHMRNHHSGARATCLDCGKTFVNKDSLVEHQLIHQGIKNYECPECGKKFRTRNQIRHHMIKHSDAKEFYCVECDARFKSAHTLRQHLKKTTKHRDKRSLKFECSSCGKRFESGRVLQAHCRVQHEGVREHRCGLCPAALASRASLAKHQRTVHCGHRAPPAHVCHACGKQFRAKSTLVNHVRTHTGEKPFACAECGRRFAQRTAMRTHIKLVHLKLHRTAKLKSKVTLGVVELGVGAKAEQFPKQEPPLAFEWSRQLPCDYFTVTAGP